MEESQRALLAAKVWNGCVEWNKRAEVRTPVSHVYLLLGSPSDPHPPSPPPPSSHVQVEASSARNGIGLVKLMGRQSGFIAMQASMASGGGDL